MAGLTGSIERFLKQMLAEATDGSIEIGRNDLAVKFNCAPSQINYVLTTRFTPYKGYYIESRRGGSGYIRIVKLTIDTDNYIEKILRNVVGEAITGDTAHSVLKALHDEEMITDREYVLMQHAIGKEALKNVSSEQKNEIRANVLAGMLLAFLRQEG